MPKSKSKLNYTNDKSFISTYTSLKSQMNFSHSQDSSFQTLMSLYTSSSATAEPPYNLTLSLPDLLLPKLKSNGLPARPRNAFILFLRDYVAKTKQQHQQHPNKNQKLTINEISYYATKEWNLQLPHVTRFFEVLSMTAKEIHQSLYPDYKYRPKRKYAKIKINENKINNSINNSINNPINQTINDSISNSINIPINHTINADSFPNLDVDFELYDEPKEEEVYYSLFPTS